MKYTIGVFVSFIGFYMASKHLNQQIDEYWDYVAFFVVIFGTSSVLFISAPAVSWKFILKLVLHKFVIPSSGLKKSAENCMTAFISKDVAKEETIENSLLRDGLEMLALNFEKDKIQQILAQRFEIHSKKMSLVSHWLKRNAKYPPAFGLAGTVLGLIHLMRGISAGIDTKETGLRMAVALVATFYGLLIANLILNPIGEWLGEEIKKEEIKAEMAIDTLTAIAENINTVEFQEMINSYLEPHERLDLVSAELQKVVA